MDEVLFRSSQKFENLQVQLSLAASQSKDLFQQYSEQSKSAALQVWNSSYSEQVKNSIHALWDYVVNLSVKAQQQLWQHLDPQKLYYSLAQVFWKKWTKRDVCFLCAGFVCGSAAGMIFALTIKKKESIVRYMQAIQCTNYLGIESAAVVENARAPDVCNENEVIISVKAASVHVVDAQICSGYGKRLRKILQKIYNKHSNGGLPVTLGRDCTGIITDVGSNVRRLEIGDEVWLTVPFWHEGTMSQCVIIPEFRIGRKPKNVGFEGACSLPYAGTLALSALRQIQVDQDNAENRRFLVLDGCTPVGSVLIQILKHWKANITTSCTKRSVPVAKALGASEVIVSPEPVKSDDKAILSLELPHESLNAFQKELELRDKFDFVIMTKKCVLNTKTLEDLCLGRIVSTQPEDLYSDSCGFLSAFFIQSYIYIKSVFEKVLGASFNDFDEGHMCYVSLDELAEMVENGYLQTVVDKVLHPQDIEIALNHIQSWDSIGSTVVTFR
ncbi:reticulon-4-interacting protein 1, mitochondrial-like [Zophobas morio]|uniref:reticulon-4-interacting protein 1, mitochondrial-like n=1 Tax=Zophobas morio TaxID=2755281 RepID=UPI003083D807